PQSRAEQSVIVDQQKAGARHEKCSVADTRLDSIQRRLSNPIANLSRIVVRKDYWRLRNPMPRCRRGRIPRLVHTTLNTHSTRLWVFFYVRDMPVDAALRYRQ